MSSTLRWVIGLGVAVAAAALLWSSEEPPEVVVPAPTAAPFEPATAPTLAPAAFQTPEPESATASLVPVDPYEGVLAMASGETIVIRSEDLRSGRPVRLRLALPEPVAAGTEVLAVRLLVLDGREPYVTEGGAVTGDRLGVEVELEADRLRLPGRYVVEMRTTEVTHIPLRRYAIEVRKGE